jgi:hypothetical protein
MNVLNGKSCSGSLWVCVTWLLKIGSVVMLGVNCFITKFENSFTLSWGLINHVFPFLSGGICSTCFVRDFVFRHKQNILSFYYSMFTLVKCHIVNLLLSLYFSENRCGHLKQFFSPLSRTHYNIHYYFLIAKANLKVIMLNLKKLNIWLLWVWKKNNSFWNNEWKVWNDSNRGIGDGTRWNIFTINWWN